MTSVVNIALPSQIAKQKVKPDFLLSSSTVKTREESKIAKKEIAQMQDNESGAEAQEADNADEKNVLDEMIIGKGIGNALKVMRDRNLLGKS